MSSQGVLVGVRQTTDAIVNEYAAADPTYRTKTAVSFLLEYADDPANSQSRHCRSSIRSTAHVEAMVDVDGEVILAIHFRLQASLTISAIAFGYFESLVRVGDPAKFQQEEVRLRSLANVTAAAGWDWSMVEDFADEMFDLLRKMSASLQTGDSESTLVDAFNDEGLQNSIITYLRVR